MYLYTYICVCIQYTYIYIFMYVIYGYVKIYPRTLDSFNQEIGMLMENILQKSNIYKKVGSM